MFSLWKPQANNNLITSDLLDQNNFYDVFMRDLSKARTEVIIESPFISFKRLNCLLPTFHKLIHHKVQIIINTKPLNEQKVDYGYRIEECIDTLMELGVEILVTGKHHRKLAIIDRHILYEGSLNILSQNDSCEIMRRIHSEYLTEQMVEFIGINDIVKNNYGRSELQNN